MFHIKRDSVENKPASLLLVPWAIEFVNSFELFANSDEFSNLAVFQI